MKKRILTFGVVLVFVTVLLIPGTVLASDYTDVIGNVDNGYTFTAPSAVILGTMLPSTTPYKASSTDGSLVGNNPTGYTVTGVDESLSYTGYMVSGSYVLTNMLEISNEDASYVTADTPKTFVYTTGATNTTVSLYVSQMVDYTDTPDSGYTITIFFTVTEN